MLSDNLVDVLRIEGINAHGFGTIPKTVTRDTRLPIGAKGLYAYFCSFAGSGNTAFPGRDTILRDLHISKDTYYKHLNMLKELDYIRVEQRMENCCFKRNIFTIVACPDQTESGDDSPCPEKQDARPASDFSPCPKKQDTRPTRSLSPCPKIRDTVCPEKQDTNNNKENINKINNLPINHISKLEKMEKYLRIVKKNIDFETLCNGQSEDIAKSILEVIIDTLCSDAKYFKIKGGVIDASMVKRRMLMLNYFDIAYILNTIGSMTEPIHNPKRYLRSVLYNAPASSSLYWATEINSVQQRYLEREQEKERAAQLARSMAELRDIG